MRLLVDGIAHHAQQIAREDFPIPKLPPPPPKWNRYIEQASNSPLPSSPLERAGSPDADKENADPAPAQPAQTHPPAASSPQKQDTLNGGQDFPPQLQDMLDEITSTLRSFTTNPPHTIQRIAELILTPKRHYRTLTSYLHALDRVVHVTSPSSTYPLPLPNVSFANGAPADTVSWANTAQNNPGADEALGGALFTPIPWINKDTSQRELRTESTETIEGPNGVGSIETVSISVNGVSFGRQGEVPRQEQEHAGPEGSSEKEEEVEDDEEPHARGPDELGASDVGPTILTVNRIDENSLQPQEIDLEAAVGRKLVSRTSPESADEGGEAMAVEEDGGEAPPKREAGEAPEGELSPKKARSERDEDVEGAEES